jgi:thiol-disulfide isomerase/thioredoxin
MSSKSKIHLPISINALQTIESYLTLPHEICGNLTSVKDIREIDQKSLVKGVMINGRQACRHKRYSSVIFHTHPINTYPYPSTEDVKKVATHEEVSYSLVGTSAGLWVMFLEGKVEWDEKIEKEVKKLSRVLMGRDEIRDVVKKIYELSNIKILLKLWNKSVKTHYMSADSNVLLLSNDHFDSQNNLVYKNKCLVLVYGDYCGFCTEFKPAFKEASRLMRQNGWNVYSLAIKLDAEGDDAYSKLASKVGSIFPDFKGVPHVALFEGGKVVDTFRGDRTTEGLLRFVVADR